MITEQPPTRTGFDEDLQWRIFGTTAHTAAEFLRDIEQLPEDGIMCAEDISEDVAAELRAAGVICSFNMLDITWLVAGPDQRARAKRHHEGYRRVGRGA